MSRNGDDEYGVDKGDPDYFATFLIWAGVLTVVFFAGFGVLMLIES